MASSYSHHLFSFLTFSSFILLHCFAASQLVPPETICQSTPHPSYCKTVLPNQKASVYDFGRASTEKSLSQSHKFLSLVGSYLQTSSSLSQPTIRALDDCRSLAEENVNLITTSYNTETKASQTLSTSEADDIQTLLSAIITNQQTCLEGLESTATNTRIKNEVSLTLSDDTKLHSVSLALFTKGWVPQKKISRVSRGRHLNFKNGKLPLKMSDRVRAVYDAARRHHNNGLMGRKLLQSSEDDSVVVNDIVVVSQDGSGNFTTINEAIAVAPNNTASGAGYFMIYVTAGVYEEYVSIDSKKKYLLVVGDGINQTIITGNHSVVDGWTTFNSATFAVVAQGFVAVGITFRNTAGAIKHQAVAMRSGADMSTFYSCSFEAYQDTLYTHSKRQFYRECDIYGTVDFIFGNAAVVLQNCNIYPRLPMSGQFNAITAQGRTDPNQNTGTSIQNAVITPADDLAPYVSSVNTYLGRPWKEYSRTVYMQSYMDSFINSAGWREWSGDFALSTLYYAEYNNTGDGADTTNRVTWEGYHVITNATVAENFTVSNFLSGDDWLPQTGVPYVSGLL